MERIWEKAVASSSRAEPRQINDSVYEVFAPQERRPSVEIVFFHGLQLEGYERAHFTTWLSRDQSELWLYWILEKIPNARILTILYNGQAKGTYEEGLMDMYQTRENLLTDMTDAEVGQDGCPVVLVGHGVGGLVMKELCIQANSILDIDPSNKPDIPVKNFLNHLKALFFFGTPHHGTRLADKGTRVSKGPLFVDAKTNMKEAAPRNEDFCRLRKQYGWRTSGVAEGCISHLVSPYLGTFTGFIVAEASARSDVDAYYTDTSANHFEVCRPHSRKSSSFQQLSNFVSQVVKENKKIRQGHKISFPDEVIGLQDQVNLVLKKLKQAPRLGIVGMGGSGKTTLAKAVYNAISQRFEYSCFLPEVKKLFADEENPDDLRATIVKELYWKGRRVPEDFQWSKLRGKSVLIVLDDAETGSQVRVMTDSDGFLEESRVIVTSRDQGILMDFRCHIAGRLNDDDSRKLFCWHAFRTTSAPEGFQDHLQKMLKKCAGLPLALKIVGRDLYKCPKRLWDAALEKFTLAQPLTGATKDGLWSILTVSYLSLARAEREMFLDVATFFHGKSLNTAKTIWEMCGWKAVERSWENLLDKCLVAQVPQDRYSPFRDIRRPSELNDYLRKMDKLGEFEPDDEGVRDCIIEMHEVLRDLGQSRACPNPRHVVDHTRASYNVFNPEAFRAPNQGQPKLEVLNISNPHRYDNSPIMNIGTFHGLNDLRILSLDGGVFEGALYVLPRRLMCLQVRNLRAWIDSGFLRYLEILDCFALRTLPSFREQLHHLKHLVISWCKDQSSSHISEQRQTLRYLEIRDCLALRTLPSSLEQLHHLKNLTISCCNELQVLPCLARLQALEDLTIDDCKSLEDLPECLGELQGLKYIRIKGCLNLKRLPDSFGKLQSLQHLEILNCRKLVLSHAVGQLENLEHLEINGCYALGTLGNVIGQLTALRHLEVESGDDSDVPLSNLGQLKSLEYLSISESFDKKHCWETLWDDFGELRSLKQLWLGWTQGIKALPNTLGDFSALEVLFLECRSLESLPETLGELQDLKALTIRSYDLKTLPDSLGQLGSLQYLHIQAPLEALPNTVGGLHSLKYLHIFALSLKALPLTVSGLRALEYLHLHIDGHDWESLPYTLGQLSALTHLGLVGFSNLKSLPESLEYRPRLGLRLVGCDKNYLLRILQRLQALEELEIGWCSDLTTLPDKVAKISYLKRLKLDTCEDLETIPDSLGQLESLEHLEIERCKNLKDLPDSLKRRGFTLAPQESFRSSFIRTWREDLIEAANQ